MIIRKGPAREAFPAERTAKKGVYRATVVFPSRGTWSYGVEDGMDKFEPGIGRVHRFPPVKIAAGVPTVAEPPLPISGEISEEEIEAAENAPRGQLPPETFRVASHNDDDSGSGAMFPALAFLLAAAVAGPVWLRRRRNNKRAT
jgi:MYXO-CTERM domain-containing protein